MKYFAVLPLMLGVSVFAQTTPATAPSATKPSPAAAAASANSAAVPDGKVVMTVGDQKITAKEFDQMIEALPQQYRAQAKGPMKRQMAEQIARMKMLASEARKRGLDKEATTQAKIRFQEDNLLAAATYEDMVQKTKVDDAAVQSYYNEHKNDYESVTARHILVKFKGSPVPQREGKPELTEDQALAKAQEIKKQLAGGSDFAAIAKAESDDTGSGVTAVNLEPLATAKWCPSSRLLRSSFPSARSAIRSRPSSVTT